eukprot:COSAG06_NODE_25311_length_640_cov_0.765250_2_plen_64_part_01
MMRNSCEAATSRSRFTSPSCCSLSSFSWLGLGRSAEAAPPLVLELVVTVAKVAVGAVSKTRYPV